MNYKAWLFLLFLFIISDTIAAAFGSYTLYRYRNGRHTPYYLSLLLFGIFAEGTMLLFAQTFGFETKPEFTTGYAVCYWIGRTIKSVTVWSFVLYISGYRGKKEQS